MIRKLITSLSLLLLILAGGCSVDEPLMLPTGDKDAALTLLIPSTELARATGNTRGAEIATRAHATSADLKVGEGAINDLYVIGFYTEDGARKHIYSKLTPEMGKNVDGVYRSYSFDVNPATYNLYIIANVTLDSDLLSSLATANAGDTAETALEKKIQNLQYSYPSLPNTTTGLPMSGESLGVQVTKGTSSTVKVDLKFLCAKVRLTIIHEDDLGETGLKVASLKAENAYIPVNFFTKGENQQYTAKKTFPDAAAVSGHYAIDAVKGKTLTELSAIPTNALQDPLENLGDPLTTAALEASTEGVYQSVSYLPESPVITVAANATALTASLTSSKGETKNIQFPLGCTSNATDHNKNQAGNQLQRGHFYDVVAKMIGSDIEFSWSVTKWEVEDLSIELAGNSELTVDKTVIDKVSGNESAIINYTTSAPKLSFESATITVGGKEVPVFELKENRADGTIEVSLGSAVKTEVPAEKRYFWVIAGSIRKYIKVTEVDSSPFLRITPAERHLYISQIVNEYSYNLWYDYSTNMDSFTLKLTDYVNKNTKKGTANISVRIYTGTEDEPLAFTKAAALEDNLDLKSLPRETATAGDEFPQDGLICITVTEPTDQGAFGTLISGTFEGVGTQGSTTLTRKATFEINPNATKYIIHFRAINDDWGVPHVYVYQPLTFYSKTKKKEYDVFDLKENLNWLEYSFTGNVVFKGWESEKGSVPDLSDTDIKSVTQDGNTFDAFRVWADDGKYISTSQYYTDIDLISAHRTKLANLDDEHSPCSACKNGGVNTTWPGVQMYKDDDNPGWWTIELPMLAEPGKALVMFANTHSDANATRFPGAKIPGIPLPNFASCEAWFLYDGDKASQMAFSDYPRTAYSNSIVTPIDPDPDPETVTYKVTFRAPLNTTDDKITKNLYIWTADGPILDSWPGSEATGEKSGYAYWTCDMTMEKDKVPTDVISAYLFTKNGNTNTTSNDINWSDNHHAEVTDADTKTAFGNCDYLFTIWATGSTEPQKPTIPEGTEDYYVIGWPNSWSNSNQFHLFIKEGNNVKSTPFGDWNSGQSNTTCDYNNTSYKWIWCHKNDAGSYTIDLSSGWQFILHSGDSKHADGDKNFNGTNVDALNATDVPEDVRTKLATDKNGKVYKAFIIKDYQ